MCMHRIVWSELQRRGSLTHTRFNSNFMIMMMFSTISTKSTTTPGQSGAAASVTVARFLAAGSLLLTLTLTINLLVVVLDPTEANAAEAAKPKPVSLFDGRTFQGWEGDTNKTWRIEDGALVGGSMTSPVPRNEFLSTTRSYTNFVLRLKFKLLGGPQANAGVQFRTKRIPNNHEVSGFQADMGDPAWWGCLYDESRRNRVLAKSNIDDVNKVMKRGEWNDYTIRAEGNHIVLSINGIQTVDYVENESGIDGSGIVAVQIHGGPASEAWYKEITIEELP